MSRITDIANSIGSVKESSVDVMEFGQTDHNPTGSRTIRLWKDMENVRYKGDGIRQDLKVRGGTTATTFTGGGDIITLFAFTSSYEGTTYNYLMRHTANRLYLDNLTTNTTTTYAVSVSFKTDVKIQHIVIGKFLYLFDTGAGEAWYIDLSSKEIFEWYTKETGTISTVAWIEDNDFTDKNIWGFKEHGSVLVYRDKHVWNTWNLADLKLPKGVYSYTFNSGKNIRIDGVDYYTKQLFTFEKETTFSIEGTGTDFTLRSAEYPIPIINGKIDFSPQLTTINSMDDEGRITLISPWSEDSDILRMLGDENRVFPTGVDLSALLNSAGRFRVTNNTITAGEFLGGDMHRAYRIMFELNDGSFTYLSATYDVTIDAADIFVDVDGAATFDYRLQKKGLRFTITDIPTNAVKGYLVSTRWQLAKSDCYGVRPEYPNGTFYISRTFDITETVIDDYTTDAELLDDVSSLVPWVGGKPAFLHGGAVQPNHVSGVKGSILIGGYTLNKPLVDDFIVYSGTGAIDTQFELFVYFEYSDGTISSPLVKYPLRDGSNTFSFKPLSALIESVVLVIEDESGAPDTYLYKKINNTDAEFFGLSFTVPNSISGLSLYAMPSTLEAKPSLLLDNYVALAVPGQMIDITSQKPLNTVERIERVFADTIDSQRGEQLRYLMYVLTNKSPVLAYLDADLTTGVFTINEEAVAGNIPLLSPFSSTIWGDRVVYQSYDGLYIWKGNTIERLIDTSRYSVLGTPLLDAAYHSREHELWLLGDDNTVLVLSDRLSNNREQGVVSYLMKYNGTTTNDLNAITAIGNSLYGGFKDTVALMDVDGVKNDDSVSDETEAVVGRITSDYLSPTAVQLYMEVMELIGEGIDVTVLLDLQDSRFDNGGSWTSGFNTSMTADEVAVSMKGIFVPLYKRGLQPRIRLEITPTGENILSAARLFYAPIKNEGASRF